VWTAKDNQPELREEIALLFARKPRRSGWSAPPTDFRRATTITKGHGRLEKRTITVRSLLAGYSTFPSVAQVFQVESWTQLTGGRSRHEIRYGLTSLPAPVASPERLLELVRGQWQIENGLHYRRDMTLAAKITHNCAWAMRPSCSPSSTISWWVWLRDRAAPISPKRVASSPTNWRELSPLLLLEGSTLEEYNFTTALSQTCGDNACHSARGEESLGRWGQILRCTQNDRPRPLFSPLTSRLLSKRLGESPSLQMLS
jgi:hypothetical protein